MGSEVTEVEDKLPGLRFTVKSATRSARYGTVELHCSVDDAEMWDRCIKKLDGLKLFSTTQQEVMDALGEEIEAQASEVTVRDKAIERLEEELADSLEENARLKRVLSKLGLDLGLVS